MRPERLSLNDILAASDDIAEFLANCDRQSFLGNKLIQSAVLQKLIVIGEAAARMPKTARERYPEVEWRDIVDFRNIAVHEYFSVQWEIVWLTATDSVPELRNKIHRILSSSSDS